MNTADFQRSGIRPPPDANKGESGATPAWLAHGGLGMTLAVAFERRRVSWGGRVGHARHTVCPRRPYLARAIVVRAHFLSASSKRTRAWAVRPGVSGSRCLWSSLTHVVPSLHRCRAPSGGECPIFLMSARALPAFRDLPAERLRDVGSTRNIAWHKYGNCSSDDRGCDDRTFG